MTQQSCGGSEFDLFKVLAKEVLVTKDAAHKKNLIFGWYTQKSQIF